MQPQKHLLATCSVLLVAALLAACAAPAAAPAPPTDTPAPPATEFDSVAVVQAWVEAINNGDEDAALALMTDDIDFSVWEYNANGKEDLRRWIFDWWVGLDTKYQIVECRPQGNQVSCSMNVVDGCIAAFGATEGLSTKMTLVVQEDGKISEISGNLDGARWNDYFGNWSPPAQSWMRVNRAEELAKIDPNPDRKQAGALQIKLCRDYETAVKTQEPATVAAAQGLVNALNSGDTDAALALLPNEAKFQMLNDEAEGADQLRSMFDWLAGKETQYQITDCEWQGISTRCAVSVTDGCIAASAAADGLHGTMTFYSLEDGTLRQVNVAPTAVERKAYEAWLEAETAWASADRAEDLAQAEGYSTEAGTMAVKLCQEYAAAPKLDAATVAEIDAIVQTAMTDYPTPGFEMCIVQDGQIVYNKGFGMADVADDRPMTPRSVSNQASISKSLTAMAVMQLVEQGKIDLDAPVTTYLPYFTMADPRFKDITVRMLLSHVSGLPDGTWDVPLDPAIDPLEQAVRSLSDQQLLSAPGEQWNYSGWGYSALGDMIAKVSGQAFASYMQEHLLQPMGMANSTFVMDEVDPDLGITRYISAEDGSALMTETAFDARDLPADGLWSNCEDMVKWARLMLNKGELNGTLVLQPESIDAMWTSAAGTFWLDALGPWYGPYVGEYGLGWYVGEKSGHRLAGHAGASDGVNTHIQFAPDDGLAVIAMDNWLKPDPDWYPAGFAAFDVMDLMLGLEPEE